MTKSCRNLQKLVICLISVVTIIIKQNNYRVTYELKIKLSNNDEFTVTGLKVTIPDNNGNSAGSKDVVRTFNLGGKDYTVSYTVTVNF